MLDEEFISSYSNSCGSVSLDLSQLDKDLCMFWLEGVLMIIVGCMGLVGNTLSILTLVFTRDKLNNVFHRLLLVLSGVDLFLVLLIVLDYGLIQRHSWPVSEHSAAYVILFPKVLFPLYNIISSLSTYITLALAFERFLAVCQPLYYRQVSVDYSLAARTGVYILPAVCTIIHYTLYRTGV
ncbi:FMRFamide receptor isoform X2 [Eurytemora carolleeae]|uniref:FMRFamide receptor isoform X2 n=1 Tax=Eurytemora carolleeae TaxID=1294199 RepID=UPI000C78ECE0|nr:FMRFamide receptor isoform X2 [Eurytemora carolleeae]|eukprot:XP_023347699.1 FMRFamide receptor-like isoform X2 [Eurytemora affinis]